MTFSNISEGKCTLSWSEPANDGCSEITHYVIEKRETAKISWALVSDECTGCSFDASKLIKTNEYQFRASAVNKFGMGRPLESTPVIAQMQYSKLDSLVAHTYLITYSDLIKHKLLFLVCSR